MITLARIVVVAFGLYLVGLASAVFLVPARTEQFLRAFASSARSHYTEQVLRLSAGAALVIYGSEMRFPELFTAFGWLMVGTAAALFLTPWRWHQRFGVWAIPLVVGHLRLFALGAAGLGVLLLYAVR